MKIHIVYCAGATSPIDKDDYDKPLTEDMKTKLLQIKGVVSVDVVKFSPVGAANVPEGTHTNWWVNYEADHWGYDRDSTRIAKDRISKLTDLEPEVTVQQILQEDPKAFFVFVGCSNGAVLAGDLTVRHKDKALGLLCLSGVPTDQQWSDIASLSLPKVTTISKIENYFGGPEGLYTFARKAWFDVFTFNNRHAEEDLNTLHAVSHHLCKKVDEFIAHHNERGRSPSSKSKSHSPSQKSRKSRSRSSKSPGMSRLIPEKTRKARRVAGNPAATAQQAEHGGSLKSPFMSRFINKKRKSSKQARVAGHPAATAQQARHG